jgi:spore photoproduct lyase
MDRFTFQQRRRLDEIARDFEQWGLGSLEKYWPVEVSGDGKQRTQKILTHFEQLHQQRTSGLKNYAAFDVGPAPVRGEFLFVPEGDKKLGLGRCPVASIKTRCCNLETLDVFRNCGFDCSYCSIQSFFDDDKIFVETNLAAKLAGLKINQEKTYHIGTGQSSDSLIWGNRYGVLDALLDFARQHENVILEFKTKSDQIEELLARDVPRNVICTWSLNTPIIIEKEERGTASLENRLASMRKMADKGVLVGAHFHPMMPYEGWREDYRLVFERLLKQFSPVEVAMISFGTLTYPRAVLSKIRQRSIKTKVLQMPMEEIAGKFSYPRKTKVELFSFAWQSFLPWQGKVFFYLCMEDPSLWKETLDHEYVNNEEFEEAMKSAYLVKIRSNP